MKIQIFNLYLSKNEIGPFRKYKKNSFFLISIPKKTRLFPTLPPPEKNPRARPIYRPDPRGPGLSKGYSNTQTKSKTMRFLVRNT